MQDSKTYLLEVGKMIGNENISTTSHIVMASIPSMSNISILVLLVNSRPTLNYSNKHMNFILSLGI